MTVAELYHSAQLRFGMSADNARFADDLIAACNDVQRATFNRRSWGCLLASAELETQASVRGVNLPSDFGRFMEEYGAIRLRDIGIVQLITSDVFYHSRYDSNQTGAPESCWLLGNQVQFSPIPDDIYYVNILYYKEPETILTATGEFSFPVRYMEMIKQAVWLRLQGDGYTNIQEVEISSSIAETAFRQAAMDDSVRYGGIEFNLPDKSQPIRTT